MKKFGIFCAFLLIGFQSQAFAKEKCFTDYYAEVISSHIDFEHCKDKDQLARAYQALFSALIYEKYTLKAERRRWLEFDMNRAQDFAGLKDYMNYSSTHINSATKMNRYRAAMIQISQRMEELAETKYFERSFTMIGNTRRLIVDLSQMSNLTDKVQAIINQTHFFCLYLILYTHSEHLALFLLDQVEIQKNELLNRLSNVGEVNSYASLSEKMSAAMGLLSSDVFMVSVQLTAMRLKMRADDLSGRPRIQYSKEEFFEKFREKHEAVKKALYAMVRANLDQQKAKKELSVLVSKAIGAHYNENLTDAEKEAQIIENFSRAVNIKVQMFDLENEVSIQKVLQVGAIQERGYVDVKSEK